jgi:hypothetical protein
MIKQILNTVYNSLGWKTKRKLVVILSDDWGSIRVPSKESREKLIALGIDMNTNRFNKFDSLESNLDLENLFEVLLHHKDCNGNHPVFTAMTNVANPDFNNIKNNDFRAYFYEPFTESLKRYPNCDKVYEYYKSGIENKIFIPEFHGREHLNVNRWMNALKNNSKNTKIGFENHFFMLAPSDLEKDYKKSFGPAFDTDSIDDVLKHQIIVKEGLEIFKDLFGYSSILFTAPSQIFDKRLEKTLFENGIKLLDVPRLEQKVNGNVFNKTKINYIGTGSTFDVGDGYSFSYGSEPGHYLRGWTLTKDGTTIDVEDGAKKYTMPGNNITFYAVWGTDHQAAIVYKSSNESMGTVSSAAESSLWSYAGVAEGSTATAKSGYHFVDWTDKYGREVSKKVENTPNQTRDSEDCKLEQYHLRKI